MERLGKDRERVEDTTGKLVILVSLMVAIVIKEILEAPWATFRVSDNAKSIVILLSVFLVPLLLLLGMRRARKRRQEDS